MLSPLRTGSAAPGGCVVALLILILVSGNAFPQSKAAPQKNPRPPRIVSIHFGLSSGMCYGYCSYELNVERGTAVLQAISQGEDKQKCPDLKVSADLSETHWKELTESIDRDSLLSLPPKIGCPGCVDEPVESIEVRFSDHAKMEIYYNAGDAPNELKALSARLSALKEKLVKELPPTYARRCEM